MNNGSDSINLNSKEEKSKKIVKKNNEGKVTIRVWKAKGKDSAGHASLQTSKIYASFWPSEQTNKNNLINGVTGSLKTLKEDIKLEERQPDRKINLYSLNVESINQEFDKFKNKNLNWRLLSSGLFSTEDAQNCSGLVYSLLKAGNIDELFDTKNHHSNRVSNTIKAFGTGSTIGGTIGTGAALTVGYTVASGYCATLGGTIGSVFGPPGMALGATIGGTVGPIITGAVIGGVTGVGVAVSKKATESPLSPQKIIDNTITFFKNTSITPEDINKFVREARKKEKEIFEISDSEDEGMFSSSSEEDICNGKKINNSLKNLKI